VRRMCVVIIHGSKLRRRDVSVDLSCSERAFEWSDEMNLSSRCNARSLLNHWLSMVSGLQSST